MIKMSKLLPVLTASVCCFLMESGLKNRAVKATSCDEYMKLCMESGCEGLNGKPDIDSEILKNCEQIMRGSQLREANCKNIVQNQIQKCKTVSNVFE